MNYRGYDISKDGNRCIVWIGDDPALDSPSEEKAKLFVDNRIKKEHRERANFKFT